MEALAAATIAGLALGALAAVAALSTRSLRLARDTSTALALAAERLETLRAGEPGDGEDDRIAPDGTIFHRRWQHAGGRGTPHRLRARVEWPGHALELASEAAP